MKQFKTVFKFEYLNYLRSKAYVVTTIVLIMLVIIAGSIPAISGLFKSITGSDGTKSAVKDLKSAMI
ncbi:MAG: hypothetical protein LBN30_07725, partial [Oscillospiraceae bacterium]|nr:hypothetical protein [Oscillospiraceae bacterium]